LEKTKKKIKKMKYHSATPARHPKLRWQEKDFFENLI
jgi:hypothetical protein